MVSSVVFNDQHGMPRIAPGFSTELDQTVVVALMKPIEAHPEHRARHAARADLRGQADAG